MFLVLVPVATGFTATVAALVEFAWGGPIYGPGGHPWAYGEWVISYAAGFVRRGLSGEFLIPLIHLTGSAGLPYLAVTGTLAVVVFGTVLLRYARHGRSEATLLLILPTTVLFPLWDYNVAGRKEQLVLALAAVLALRRDRRPDGEGDIGCLVVGLVGAVLMMLHEGLIFFMPLLFALLEIARPPTPTGAQIRRFALMVGPAALACLAVAVASHPLDTAPLFEAVPEYGPGMRAWCEARGIGSICWLGFPADYIVAYGFAIGYAAYVQGLALVGLQSALVTAVYLRVRNQPVDRRVAGLLAFGWAGLAPLYLIAFDWGRWDAAAGMLFVLLAPLAAARPRSPAALVGFGLLFSVFTVGHMQSTTFEIGGPLLAKRVWDSAAAALAP